MAVREINGEPAYEVEAILDYRGGEDHWKNREFLVKWKDFGPEEDSWEPRLNLRCPTVLRPFLLSKGLFEDVLIKRMTVNQKRSQNRRRRRTDRGSVSDDIKPEKSAISSLGDRLDIRLPTNSSSINAHRSAQPFLAYPSPLRNDENETPSNFKQEEQEIQIRNDDEVQQVLEKIPRNRKRRSRSTAADIDVDGNLGINSENRPVNTRSVLQDVARNASDQVRASSEDNTAPSTSGHLVSSDPEVRRTSCLAAPNKLIFKFSESTPRNLAPSEPTSTPVKSRKKHPSVDSGFNTASTSPNMYSEATSSSTPKVSPLKIRMVGKKPICKKKAPKHKVKKVPKSSWASRVIQQLQQLPPMDEHIKKNVEPAAEPSSKKRKVGDEKECEKTDVAKSAEDMLSSAPIITPKSVPPPTSGTSLLGRFAYLSLFEIKDPAFPYKHENVKQEYRLDPEVKKECVTAAVKKLSYSYHEFKTKEESKEPSALESLNLAISMMKLYKNEKKDG